MKEPLFIRHCILAPLSSHCCGERCGILGSRKTYLRRPAGAVCSNALCEEVGHIVRKLHAQHKCPSVSSVTTLLPATALKDRRAITASVKAARQEAGQMHSS